MVLQTNTFNVIMAFANNIQLLNKKKCEWIEKKSKLMMLCDITYLMQRDRVKIVYDDVIN